MLYLTGRSLPHVMMMLIPEAWDGNEEMDPVKSLLRISCLFNGAMGWPRIYFIHRWKNNGLHDRNGLRLSRYCVTTDGRVIMGSTGALPVDQSIIKERKAATGQNVLI